MRKITNLIVKYRYFFLTLFVLLGVFCLYLSTKVNINEDIMKYLPPTSETKIGKDIMEKEFAEEDSSILNVMFKDLSDKEKEETLKKLEAIDGVSSVSYDNTDEYNKDHYTLYVLNVDDYDHSETATNVYNYVQDHFKTAGLSGSIYQENKPILQLWIVVLAIACAMVILILLSESYVEPWLYLISIGIAVFINKGTNIMFDSVSSITNSIVAILQLALSMDYSIMLSNRYKQEKENYSDKREAMKEALYHSFKAISSSSVTTIVGLIALVFMSFTIGKDLGYVLAKGVLLSLVSIFFCLPALLLMFDNLIAKTKKKAPKINLTTIGNFVYKTRWLSAILIVLLFVIAYLLKGNVNILFTDSEQDKVGKVFPATNQIAIVYNNQYEELISNYCKKLEKDEKIDQTLCYSNTINEKLAYDELNKKFKDLGEDVEIEQSLIKIIYYNYYNQDENNKMSLDEFISFIKSDIYPNDQWNKSLTKEMKNNIDLLENFTSSSLMGKKRTTQEIAEILGMKEEDAKNILLYYNSKNITTTMTIKDFVNFMLNDVAKDSKYSKSLDKATLSKLKQLQNFTDLSKINKKMTASELSNIFGIDQNLIEQLFLFYRTTMESNTKLTLQEFATFAIELSREDAYKEMFDKDTLQSLTVLKSLSDENNIKRDLELSLMKDALDSLGISLEENTLYLLYTYYTGYYSESKLTFSEFATIALNMAQQESYFDDEIIKSLNIKSLKKIQVLSSQEAFDRTQLYEVFGVKEKGALLDLFLPKTLTSQEFVYTLLNTPMIFSQLDDNQKASLNYAESIIDQANTKFSKSELATTLSKDETIVSIIYGVYDSQNPQIGLSKISIQNFINFLYLQRENPLLKPSLEEKGEFLQQAYFIVNHTDTSYNYTDISKITGTNSEQVAKIVGVYDYNHQTTEKTPLEFANFVLKNKDNELLKNQLSSSSIEELSLVKEVMNSTIQKTKYTSSKLSSLLGIDQDTMSLLFSLYDSKYIKNNQQISLYDYVDFLVKDVMNNKNYASNFDDSKKEKLTTINNLMKNSLTKTEYTSKEAFDTLHILTDQLDRSLLDLVYMDYGSSKEYQESWKMTIEEFVHYLNSDIITDPRFDDFIDKEKRTTITDAKETVDQSKKLIVSDSYSRVVLNTKYAFEDEETYEFINSIQDEVGKKDDIYVVGNSPMAVEMSKTFNGELNKITLLTMIFIFVVVAITFKDLIIPFVLVLIIQTAVYITMSGISLTGGSVYFIALLIVQAILMGATIDYAIVYTSYYRESRLTMGVKDSVVNAYNRSIHTILSSSSILIIVTLVVANFASAIAAKICETISQGTFASVILILFILPGVLAATDKLICRKGYYNRKN